MFVYFKTTPIKSRQNRKGIFTNHFHFYKEQNNDTILVELELKII